MIGLVFTGTLIYVVQSLQICYKFRFILLYSNIFWGIVKYFIIVFYLLCRRHDFDMMCVFLTCLAIQKAYLVGNLQRTNMAFGVTLGSFTLQFCLAFCFLTKVYSFCRAIAPGVLEMDVFGFQTLQHVMRMTRTWDSTMSMIPKGGDTIWGGFDWSPEEGYECVAKKMKNSDNQTAGQNGKVSLDKTKRLHYGRIISFGKDVADAESSKIERMDFRVMF